ncbi:DNA methyltransferase [Paenibacillus naphthalenovorans]|uniref:DNA methyltransferase n=1 Tax=Paenibacillus naphthalenovorans TaxID=162209 RepID=UPI003D2D4002
MADKVEQLEMLNENQTTQTGPVTCLGMTFENDEARRAYFTEVLRKKLPELRKIEGFPIGEDEDILALSDPPYYTACPNPFISDFITEWTISKQENMFIQDDYTREPFATDVSEGKYDPLYKMHPYHTKVPHKAIMRYILHYTKPGDIIFDGFCGTGMTGVAAQLCGDKQVIESLGYKVTEDNRILKDEIDENGNQRWVEFSKLGERRVVLNDLSPAATYIASNYNIPLDVQDFEQKAKETLADVEKECKWMFETKHSDGNIGYIQYVIWSDVFICPECSNEIVFWEDAVDKPRGIVLNNINCSNCNANLKKRDLIRKADNLYDNRLKRVVTLSKQVPVLISYSVDSQRFEKKPDENDLEKIRIIESLDIPYWYPTDEMPDGVNTIQAKRSHGISNVHHFYTKRNLAVLAAFYSRVKEDPRILSVLTTVALRITKRYGLTYQAGVWGAGGGPTNGTYYIPALVKELNMLNMLVAAIKKHVEGRKEISWKENNVIISTQTLDQIKCQSNVFDYIFIDPPFGSNLNYSELNFLWESWLKVFTNNKQEAIENKVQQKGMDDYRKIITTCLKEAYRLLKPGRWITIEFSNTSAAVWNNIQTALFESGFIVSNVSILDKQKGSFKAQTTPTAVKQDLIISAYKPKAEDEMLMANQQNTEESVWIFVKQHLEKLPVFLGAKGSAEIIVERTPRILFDRMVAYHVQRGFRVPLSSAEFQAGVEQRFPMRDGMAFLETQVAEYDKKRIQAKEFVQLSLFVSDENSAIEWLRQQLLKKPQTRQDLHPNFMKEIQHIAKHELLPELDVLLEQNFLMYDGEGEVPSQIHAYLSSDYKDLRGLDKNDPKLKEKAKNRWYVPDPNKQADLEKLREKSLLREFNQYVEELSNSKKKLKQFRTEAIRVGFYKAWTEKNYQLIVDIGNRLPESILQEDEKLLRYYDNAQTKLGL